MNFSTNLKKIRKSLKLSQTQLAELIDISQRTISHYEKGDSEPELIIVCRLADAFCMSVDRLLGYDPNNDELRFVQLKSLTIDTYNKKKEAEFIQQQQTKKELTATHTLFANKD